jgi:nicotinamide-nucleotide amidase
MIARILAIGDELLLGRTIDTNSAHVSRFLTDRGLRVERMQVVGDGQRDIEMALRGAVAGAALVVVTGGLGPTDDDRTRHALAAVMGVELGERPEALAHVRGWFAAARPGKPMPEVNRRQALMPPGSAMLANDRGTAPGILARIGGCQVACLPGVPHEMKAMLDRLGETLGALVPGLRPPAIGEVWLAGIGESSAQELIGDLLTERDPQVGITVSELGHITLRVVGEKAAVKRRVAELKRPLRPHLLDAAGLAPGLVALLARRGHTIAAAESCTCGHVVAQLGAVPGASAVLREALVAYHAGVKRRRLGVPAALIRRHGVVSEPVAAAMAAGMRRLARADLAVATTGIAGPDGGSPDRPVGTLCIAVADRDGTIAKTIHLGGDRERVQRRGAAQALQLAWEVASGKAATVRSPQ